MDNSKKYTVIFENNDMIECRGIYSYYEAVGIITCSIAQDIDEFTEDGYTVIKKEEFAELEGDTGLGWFVELFDEKHNITIKEKYYLLTVNNEFSD